MPRDRMKGLVVVVTGDVAWFPEAEGGSQWRERRRLMGRMDAGLPGDFDLIRCD
ncbi:hypothetical protein [Aestuariispira ectoiniformans]|uniref:hypothetical protein n=1 Tax=Aestuariispira ectoiniformans TaxID=2775080 RepID=UPI00223BF50B|nr:hypothetical protein [Aestuariispira ectoiniformans]